MLRPLLTAIGIPSRDRSPSSRSSRSSHSRSLSGSTASSCGYEPDPTAADDLGSTSAAPVQSTTWYCKPPSDDSQQFFKEEKLKDAVYNLYLKKVRYNSPSELDAPDSDRSAILLWRTESVRVIKCGSLARLVEALSTEKGEVESTYVSTLLATYRAFSTPRKLMTAIIDRYQTLGDDNSIKQHIKENHRRTLRSVISVWLDSYPADFVEPPDFPTLRHLQSYASVHMQGCDLDVRAEERIRLAGTPDHDSDCTPPSSPPISVNDIKLSLDLMSLIGNTHRTPKPTSLLEKPVEFELIPNRIFAEQLTYIDSELFKKVVPHHCLGSVWSTRDKHGGGAPSVYATVNQFNAVSYRVIATILKNPSLERWERSMIIEKWIEIAQELRVLKNFSSLKAIISGLQSNPIYRLKKIWACVDSECIALFDELAGIFSEENNQIICRELLMREGTAKFADTEHTGTLKKTHKRNSSGGGGISNKRKLDMPSNLKLIAQGTVPYLGTFLTDLTMIDTAIPDYNEEGLINFEKRRKEFEILAQIKLLQSASQMYFYLRPDSSFIDWFRGIRVYDDSESYELSCELEPVTPTTPKEVKGHRKKSSLGFFTVRSDDKNAAADSPASSICSSEDTQSVYSMQHESSTPHTLRHSASVGSIGSMDSEISITPWKSPESYIVKVAMETADSDETNHYKSIRLTNSDRTKTVLSNILLKFNIDDQPQEFVIFQVLHNSDELELPERGNIFYAMNTSESELKFIVRRKRDLQNYKPQQPQTQRLRNKKKKFLPL